jgi:glutaredoxin 3
MNNNIVKLENGDFSVEPLSADSTIIWSKDYCMYCVKAKQLLNDSNVAFEERNISNSDWSLDQLLQVAPGVRTMPQIFMDGKHIGGFDDLDAYLFLKEEEEQSNNL